VEGTLTTSSTTLNSKKAFRIMDVCAQDLIKGEILF
jgi:hypothetical protein